MEKYDVVVIGGGINALTSAGYLSKSGLKVILLEAQNIVGGGAMTSELTLPGFKHNTHSQMHSWIHGGPVYKDLELEKYGCKYIFPDPQYACVFKNGKSIVLYLDIDKTCKEIEKFSKKDAKAYKEMFETFKGIKNLIIGSFFAQPAPYSQIFAPLEGTEQGAEFVRMMLSSCDLIAKDYFESEEVRVWILGLATTAGVMGNMRGGGAMVPMMVTMTHEIPWGIAIGGANSLAQAMVKMIEANGGVVKTNNKAVKILIENRRATGVKLENGDIIMAEKGIISSAGTQQTMLDLVGEEYIDSGLVEKAKRYHWDEMTLCTPHLALNEPPKWKGWEDNPMVNSCPWVFWGAESTIELQTQFNDITELKLPRHPGGLTCTASIHDRTQSPPDKYTTFYWQWTTYWINKYPKNWDNEAFRNEVLDNWIAKWKEYAPNLTKENILGRYLYTPTDMERLSTGHMKFASLMLGDMGLDNMNAFRPLYSVSRYKVPGINALYLTGGTTHPTGGIHGASGYNVSNVIAEDLKIRKWWER